MKQQSELERIKALNFEAFKKAGGEACTFSSWVSAGQKWHSFDGKTASGKTICQAFAEP